MKEFISQVLPAVQTALIAIVIALIGVAGNKISKAAPDIAKIVVELYNFIVAKIGLVRFQKYQLVAPLVWHKIDEDIRLGDYVGDKLTKFIKLMRIKFPTITDADINLLNKGLAGAVNKDKEAIVKAVEETTPVALVETVVTVEPTIVYKKADGTVLQEVPIVTPTV